MADLIDRNEALQRINEYIDEYSPTDEDGYHSPKWCAMQEAKLVLESCKPMDAIAVRRGYWKPVMMSEATGWDLSLTGGYDEVCELVCSVCGEAAYMGEDGCVLLTKFCPECGADLRGI